MGPAYGEGNFCHINGPLRVDCNTVGGDELSRPFTLVLIAELTHLITIQVKYSNSVTQTGGIIHSPHTVKFTHVDVLSPEDHGVWSVDIAPHSLELAVCVKYLNSVRFSIYNINVGVTVYGDIVGTDELSCIDAGFAP